MSHIPSPFYFRNGRKRKDFQNGVLTYLWIIARDIEEIKEMLKGKNSPNSQISAERAKEMIKESVEDTFNQLAASYDKRAATPETHGEQRD